jgi:two-component system CheB/CheR fusion protein
MTENLNSEKKEYIKPIVTSRNIITHPMKFKPQGDSLPISSYKELLEHENKFRTVINTAPLIWMAGIDMTYNFFNKAWTDFTGRKPEQEKNSGWMEGIHPDDLDKFQNIQTTSFNARKHFYVEFRLRRSDGHYFLFTNRGEPRYSDDGNFEGYVGNCIQSNIVSINPSVDQVVNEKIKILKENIAKLEQSNLELTQFAYVATHDLQEPLRKTRTFTDRLLIKAAARLTEDEISYLNKIKSSTARMSDLIKDVLEYSILSRSHESFPQTDLNAILKNVLTDFELLITQKKAQINADQLPNIEAVPLQMNQLFNNLISNSLKFTEKGINPVINIKQSPLTANEKIIHHLDTAMTYIKISFSDNGIGFSKEYAEQIFEIFQRLNGQEKYPGTGIGLALCKKIITNHKGGIYAESEAGNGAAFHIILPLKQELS